MSYAPIYSKLHELDARISTLENAPKTDVAPVPPVVNVAPVAPAPATLAEPVAQSTNTDAFDVSILAAYATKADIPDVSGFATKADIPDVSGFATKAELPVVPDVSGFATKDELPVVPDVSGFATKDELADLYMKFENAINVIAQLNIKINEANEKIATLETSKEAA